MFKTKCQLLPLLLFLGDQNVEASDTEVEGQVILEPQTKQNPCGIVTQQGVDD